jgi:elongation factor G
MLDICVGIDETAMEEYFDKGDVSVETLKRCIKKGTISASSARCSAARRSRTRACSRCSTPCSTTCRARWTSPASRSRPRGRGRDGRAAVIPADRDAPFAGLAFKIINDKYGNLTFVRVYRGTLRRATWS